MVVCFSVWFSGSFLASSLLCSFLYCMWHLYVVYCMRRGVWGNPMVKLMELLCIICGILYCVYYVWAAICFSYMVSLRALLDFRCVSFSGCRKSKFILWVSIWFLCLSYGILWSKFWALIFSLWNFMGFLFCEILWTKVRVLWAFFRKSVLFLEGL